MTTYKINGQTLSGVELKCLLVSCGVAADKNVYRELGSRFRLNINPLACNCMILPCGTIVQLTDVKFHLRYLSGMLSWNNLKLLRYASELGTPFSLKMLDGKAALCHNKEFITFVTFPEYTDFYLRKTTSGLPFMGNAVLQGLDWVSFQCLWACEFAASGKPCEFCFSGAEFSALASKSKPMPPVVPAKDAGEIARYAVNNCGVSAVQITGGSTFNGKREAEHIIGYLKELYSTQFEEVLLYITPPADIALTDEYFALGATRIACSLEVWDTDRARRITPGKIEYTTRQRHLDVLEYVAGKFGAGTAFSNFIIGLEPFESLKEGASYLAERGIIPGASVWMPMGRPVMGSMSAPELDYYRRVIDLFGELYERYNLEPAGCCGLNVCMEKDIWKLQNPAAV
ncbi:MAG: hypothetical protein LBD85_03815 [Oscillospiraceae bacterium]|jgi:hypothetical protein|nr:hypothetical protein [Oscillospiraceae bacterium]